MGHEGLVPIVSPTAELLVLVWAGDVIHLGRDLEGYLFPPVTPFSPCFLASVM